MDLPKTLGLDEPDMAKASKPVPPKKAVRSGSADVVAAPRAGDPACNGLLNIKRTCRNCEHYDGGKASHGDCHNGISGRLRTHIDDTCFKGFYPDTERWPLRAGEGGVR